MFYYGVRLEHELKRLKYDLHMSNQTENELKNQLNTTFNELTSMSDELTRLTQEHEDTKSK